MDAKPLIAFRRRVALSVVVTLFILVLGVSYQHYYSEESAEYREELVEAYRERNAKDPDEVSLKHWATLALGRYGIDRVEKDYILKPEKSVQ